ncbi:MAG: hypothetical protein WDA04_01315, partial [Anaerolineaceae bacterium]
ASNSPDLDAKIRFVPPILLDNIAVQLGDWSGYHLLAQYLTDEKVFILKISLWGHSYKNCLFKQQWLIR